MDDGKKKTRCMVVVVVVVMDGEREREREAANARERASKQCLLSLSLLQEKIKERTHTHTQRQTSEQEGGRDTTKKQKGFFRLLINRNHKKAQHATRVHSSLRPSVRLHPVFSYLLTHTHNTYI
jgi:hypothetical protein